MSTNSGHAVTWTTDAAREFLGNWRENDNASKARAHLAASLDNGDALLAEVEQLRAALEIYADPRHWGICRDDLSLKVISWIGPGAEHKGIPDAMQIAREALEAVRG